MVELLVCNQAVVGSNPVASTTLLEATRTGKKQRIEQPRCGSS